VNVRALQNRIGRSACDQILVLHALGGCDTTSSIYGLGKATMFNRLNSDKSIRPYVQTVQCAEAMHNQVKEVGVALMIAVYGGKPGDCLGTMWHAAFDKMVKE
jgi:hypothetical protein